MRVSLKISLCLFVFFIAVLNNGCKKDPPKVIPTLTTTAIIGITSTSATGVANIENDGGSPVTIRGICWNTSQNPTVNNLKTSDGFGIGNFISNITGLSPGTTYYFKSYATNEIGTSYGNQLIGTTLAILPSISTSQASNITTSSITCGGGVISDGGSPVTIRGVCWSTNQSPTINDSKTSDGSGISSFISSISGLNPGTTYYIRAYATNIIGTIYGNQISVTTLASLPTVTTSNINIRTQTSANGGGNVTNDGGSTVIERGICWSTNSNPTILHNTKNSGSGVGSFSVNIENLNTNTMYYGRAYATNSVGTSYGNIVTFFLFMGVPSQNATDIDGNIYHSIKIGSQEWLKENLKTTKYNDGISIPEVTDNTTWNNLLTPAYCWYSNDKTTYGNTYGGLYNWYAVNTSKLCPSGWKVPSIGDLSVLFQYLLGMDIAGAKLKDEGTTHWLSPNTGATNESGFRALPSGIRDGTFGSINGSGFWWTSSGQTAGAWFLSLGSTSTLAYTHYWLPKSSGLSVRCLKDN